MNTHDALSILGIGKIANITYAEAKKAYKVAATKYHPDRNPAGLQMMQALTEAWRYLEPLLKAHDFLHNEKAADEKQPADYGDELNEILNTLLNMHGLIIEVCGSWIWISGDTKPHKAAIKALGCMWAAKKIKWYYRPAGYERSRFSRGKFSMDDIRTKYGSTKKQQNARKAVKGAA